MFVDFSSHIDIYHDNNFLLVSRFIKVGRCLCVAWFGADSFKFFEVKLILGDILTEKSEWNKLLVSEEVRELIKEIEEKSKNPETQLEALELIETNIDKLPFKAFRIVSTLTKSENEQIREKAKQVMEKYYSKFPQFNEFVKSIEIINASKLFTGEIMNLFADQDKLIEAVDIVNIQKLPNFAEAIKSLAEWNKRLQEILKSLNTKFPKIPEIPITPPPEAIILQKIEETEQKLEELKKDIEELREIRQEDRERLKRKLKELEEELDRAYQ